MISTAENPVLVALSSTRTIPKLARLAANAICRAWHSSRSLEGIPVEVAKLLWAALKQERTQQGLPLSCSTMYPFVRHVWHVENVDLSDSSNWIVGTSLQALTYVATLRSVRLTACRFVDDDALLSIARLQLHTLDVSWTQVTDAGMGCIAGCTSLTSLNLTGLKITDQGVASLLPLTSMQRLALACTSISDAAMDYITYYTRFPTMGTGTLGMHQLRWLELSNTRLTDTGVGKLVAIIEDGVPYGKVFKQLEYLALSMTSGVGPAAVRQVRVKYGFDAPLPNAQRTLAKSNTVALEARDWVIRFMPTKERQVSTPSRSWEQTRIFNYIAQYTKEMASAAAEAPRGSDAKRQRSA